MQILRKKNKGQLKIVLKDSDTNRFLDVKKFKPKSYVDAVSRDAKLVYSSSTINQQVLDIYEVVDASLVSDVMRLNNKLRKYGSLTEFIVDELGDDLEPRFYPKAEFKKSLVENIANGKLDPFVLLGSNGGIDVNSEWYYSSGFTYIYSASTDELDNFFLEEQPEEVLNALDCALDEVKQGKTGRKK